ncbi:hypothetical protein QE152_g7796 [Popillia japonica]|uniref:Uncharacterized protein n=1 Tax=Popillia japonica TaxID=7064 RepID=A0AAW1MDZ4_POPJA
MRGMSPLRNHHNVAFFTDRVSVVGGLDVREDKLRGTSMMVGTVRSFDPIKAIGAVKTAKKKPSKKRLASFLRCNGYRSRISQKLLWQDIGIDWHPILEEFGKPRPETLLDIYEKVDRRRKEEH